jgi:hypothetical protein
MVSAKHIPIVKKRMLSVSCSRYSCYFPRMDIKGDHLRVLRVLEKKKEEGGGTRGIFDNDIIGIFGRWEWGMPIAHETRRDETRGKRLTWDLDGIQAPSASSATSPTPSNVCHPHGASPRVSTTVSADASRARSLCHPYVIPADPYTHSTTYRLNCNELIADELDVPGGFRLVMAATRRPGT